MMPEEKFEEEYYDNLIKSYLKKIDEARKTLAYYEERVITVEKQKREDCYL